MTSSASSGSESSRSRRWRATRSSSSGDLLIATLPEGPALYPEGQLTDEPEETLIAEIIREAALEGVRDELPHSIAVVVEEMVPREDRPEDKPLVDVRVNVYVERDSQKGIIIGKQGLTSAPDRHRLARTDRADPRHPGLPRPARQGRQGLAARPQAAAQARVLSRGRATVRRGGYFFVLAKQTPHRSPRCHEARLGEM